MTTTYIDKLYDELVCAYENEEDLWMFIYYQKYITRMIFGDDQDMVKQCIKHIESLFELYDMLMFDCGELIESILKETPEDDKQQIALAKDVDDGLTDTMENTITCAKSFVQKIVDIIKTCPKHENEPDELDELDD